MKRWVGGLLVFATLVCIGTLSVRSAEAGSGSDVVWRTVQIPWNSKTTAFTGSAKDTMFLQDENDSTRTDIVNTSDWAWEAMINSTSSQAVAFITITCRTNNGAADSLYYSVEKAVRGVVIRNRTLAAAVGTCALLQGDARNDKAVYRGTLNWDADGPETLNLLAPGVDFRLVVQGDQGGTTPKLSQTRIFLTYPARRASSP